MVSKTTANFIALCTLLVQSEAFCNPIWQKYFKAGQGSLANGDNQKAESLFEASLKEARLKDGYSADLAESLFAVSALTWHRRRSHKAKNLLNECLKVDNELCGEKSTPAGFTHELLGDIALSKKNFDVAESEFRIAADSLESIDATKEISSRILSKLSEVYEKQGKKFESESPKPAVEAKYDLASDIAAYSKCVQSSMARSPAPKRAQEMVKEFKINIPVIVTNGIDERGNPLIKLSSHYPSTYSELYPRYFSAMNVQLQPRTPILPNSVRGIDMDSRQYLANIERRIKRAWFPPLNTGDNRTSVTLKVAPNGDIFEEQIVISSGIKSVDQAALKAVADANLLSMIAGQGKVMKIELTFYCSKSGNGVAAVRLPDTGAFGVSSNKCDVDFGPYMADLQRRIKRAWFPPKGMETKRVVVIFTSDKVGTLSKLRIGTSSGVKEADERALLAVQNGAPFGGLPDGAGKDVDLQFTFDYNVFTGGGGGALRRF